MASFLVLLILAAGEGAWTLHLGAQPPFITTPLRASPAHRPDVQKSLGPALFLRCSGMHLKGQLQAATVPGIEPVTADRAAQMTRVRVVFDDGGSESAVWSREFGSVIPSDLFFERLATAHQALVEVPILCRYCGGAPPLHVVFTIDATGFAEARQELLKACSRSMTP